jgi:hypothetical protein
MAMPYKPGPQARFLIDKMVESQKQLQEALSKLAAQLDLIERKVDTNTVELGSWGPFARRSTSPWPR